MRVLIIGAEGQLGTALCAAFADTDLVRAELDGGDVRIDVTDEDRLRDVVGRDVRPGLVINTAAAHDVARCEREPDWAFAINATGARNVAVACRACGARLVHISTDYVFADSPESRPLVESDLPAPLNVYGVSKLAGEHLIAATLADHCIVRTAGLYGLAPCRGKAGDNFVLRMLHSAETELRVVDDEFTTPTYASSLARQIRLLAEKGEPGVYHATCQGGCSWYEFAKAIFEETGKQPTLKAVKRDCLQSPVKRPRFSVLENRRLQAQGLDIMPTWRDALREYLSDLSRKKAVS